MAHVMTVDLGRDIILTTRKSRYIHAYFFRIELKLFEMLIFGKCKNVTARVWRRRWME